MSLRNTFSSLADESPVISGRNFKGLENSEVVTLYHRPINDADTYEFTVQVRPVGSSTDIWRDASKTINQDETVDTMRVSNAMEYRVKFSSLVGEVEVVIG